jgi:hypothetical protein
VLKHLPGGFRWLKRNKREDAIAYFEAFADLLEEKLLQHIEINIDTIPAPKPVSETPKEMAFA